MPHVINGVGTWYHGKRNQVVRRGVCDSCGRVADLRSYDTTLFFVVLFVPLIPLARKHIIDQCSSCSRHRVMKLTEWETMRSERIAQALKNCNDSPRDEGLAIQALVTASSFDSSEAMDALERFIATNHIGNAKVQAVLGHALEHMNRHERATDALLRAHECAPTDETAEALAVQMFKHAEPRDALPLIDHVFVQGKTESRGIAYLGVEALQARGQHEDALRVLGRIAEAFPGSDKHKDHLRYEKSSRKRLGTSKVVKSSLAQLGRKDSEGASGGSWAGRWPWLVGPAVMLVFVLWFVWAAMGKGAARDVWLANGLGRNYTVTLAGKSVVVYPGAPVKVQVPMGDVSWQVIGDDVAVPTGQARIAENFFARPFSGRVFVLNPDKNAVLVVETGTYSANGQAKSSGDGRDAFSCRALHEFNDIDYVFQPMPASLSLSSNTQKRGLSQYGLGPRHQLEVIRMVEGEDAAKAAVVRSIQADPRTEEMYQPALNLLGVDAFEDAARAALAMRPINIEAHRAHQKGMETADPTRDIVKEYRLVLAEDSADPVRQYLLARLTHDGVEAAGLLERAISSTNPPPPYQAYMARAWARMGQANMPGALLDARRAMELNPDDPAVSQNLRHALIANNDIDGLLQHPAMSARYEDMEVDEVADKVYAYAAKGDAAGAAAVVSQAGDAWGLAANDPLRSILLAMRASVAEDWEEFARLANSPDQRFYVALRAHDFASAARLASECDQKPGEWSTTMALALAAADAGDAAVVAESLEKAVQSMASGGWEERQCAEWLRGGSPPTVEQFRMFPMDAPSKCTMAAALGVKFPQVRPQFFAFARSLNVDRRPPYSVVRQLVEKSW
mgnify:CR=1 FL=1